jgi:hypothetical protein
MVFAFEYSKTQATLLVYPVTHQQVSSSIMRVSTSRGELIGLTLASPAVEALEE